MDSCYLQRTFPRRELQNMIEEDKCLPVLHDTTFPKIVEQLKGLDRKTTETDGMDLDMLWRVTTIVMLEDTPHNPATLKQNTAFAVVQLLMDRRVSQPAGIQDVLFHQRLLHAVNYVAEPDTMGRLYAADKRRAESWKQPLERSLTQGWTASRADAGSEKDQQGPLGTQWAYDIFISHAGESKECALRLEEMFKRLNLTAFIDKNSLQGGDAADKVMVDAAKKAPVGVALLSKPFFEKEWPMRELKLIMENDALLPVLHGISYEDAKESLKKCAPESAEYWQQSRRDAVMRTTAVKNTDTSGYDIYLLHQVVFETLQLCANRCQKLAHPCSCPMFIFIQRLRKALQQIIAGELDYITMAKWKRAAELDKTLFGLVQQLSTAI
ncbi:hypothetical protein WJX72_008415 [[Myrmecia] bisecta]|uniref:TIR domain-containing protein n=1 Tax=[Myrmecia] bisecta TaxID=41462 RepID=A0AAW1P5X8_9CHLO